MSAPTPVLPASAHPAPAHALDPVTAGVPSGLEKLVAQANTLAQQGIAQAKPLVGKAVEVVKPYSDAALQKGHELMGTHPAPAGQTLDPNAPRTVSGEASPAKTMFGMVQAGLAQAQAGLVQVGEIIEQKTTTDKHPGLLTQLQEGASKAMNKAEELVGSKPAQTVGTTTTGYTTTAPVVPVAVIPTTTNTIPHTPLN